MTQSIQSLLFVSCYVSAEQPAIQSFLFDDTTRALTASGSLTCINNPTFLVAHPIWHLLYAVSETDQDSHGAFGEVWALQSEREPCTIQPINHQSSRGDWPCHLQHDGTGRWLLATNYGTGNAGIYSLQPDGSLGE